MQMSSLLPPPPRVIRIKTGTWIGRVLLWIGVIGVFIVAPIFMARSLDRIRTLMTSGKTIQADILDSRIVYGKHTNYLMTVSFDVYGQSYGGQRHVNYNVYYGYENSRTVPVVTMPNDPRDFEIGSVDQSMLDNTQSGWIFAIGMLALFIGGFCIWLEVCLFNERRLLANGDSVIGLVTNIKVVRGKSTTTYVSYEYSTTLGNRTGKASVSGNRADRFPEGSPILIVYGRDNDRNSLPFPMFQLTKLVSALE